MHDVVIRLHYITSSIFFVLAIILIVWAIVGWTKSKKYSLAFNRLSFVFILFLYIQLLTGLALYFFLEPESSVNLNEAASNRSLRFWVIEHVSLMLFALLLAQVGRLYIKQLTQDRRKFRAAVFYYGISFLVVLTSAGMALLG